ncbi:hypothetical protein Tco_0474408 [Tanacetum coccineum]
MLQDPSWISLTTYSAWRGATHHSHGFRNDFRYWTPPITTYCLDLLFTAQALFVSAGSVPSVRYSSSGVIHESPSSSTTTRISLSSIDFSFNTSTNTCLVKWAKLVYVILLRASAFLFSILGTRSMENFLNLLMSVFAFSRMAYGSASVPSAESTFTGAKRKSKDVGWEYGVITDKSVPDRIKCTLCEKVATKEDHLKCQNAIHEGKLKKQGKRQHDEAIRSEVRLDSNESLEDDEVHDHSMKEPNVFGPMDNFANTVNPEQYLKKGKGKNVELSNSIRKERIWMTKKYVARWAYEFVIPFHAFEKDSFKMLLEVVGQLGPKLPPPTRYELSTPLLKEEDGYRFLSSKKCLGEAYTSEDIYDYVDACIQEVGAEHVVQIVTDNASNNMGAAALLKVTRPKIFWTSCATHTINLMLEGIGALPRFKKILDQAKKLTIFIYSHHKTLAMMRDFTKKRDIVRPGVTKFASSFLTLQSLSEKKENLRHMFSSTEWEECRYSGTVKGKAAYATLMRYFSFGRHLEDLHVTWAHLKKKRTRLRTNTKTLEDLRWIPYPFLASYLIGDLPLRDRFDRLYHLENFKYCLVRDRFVNGSWSWNWIRPILSGRFHSNFTRMLVEIGNIEVTKGNDSCSWSLSLDGNFSVSSLRHHIDDYMLPSISPSSRWCNMISRKSSKRQPTLSRSNAETEYRGVANAIAETCWLWNLLRELHTPLSSATLVYCDNVRVLHVPSRY